MKQIVLLSVLFLFRLTGFSQNQKALLWKITGSELEKPSYIFGTIHAICEEDYFFPSYIEAAFQQTDAFFAEIDFSDTQAISEIQQSMTADTPLKERMTAEEYEKLAFLLNDRLHLSINDFEYSTFSMLLSAITLKSFECKGKIKTYEIELLQKAVLSKKTLGGLETVKEQFELLEKATTAQTLIKTLQELNETGDAEKLIALYKDQNIDAIEVLMNQFNAAEKEILLINRNKKWAQLIPLLLQKKSVFLGVGAGHLGGKTGILELLRQEGFDVEPVTFSSGNKN